MATTEEKIETIETLKGPRYYHIQLWGYGGESEYMALTKEQYEFWHAHIDEHGDSDAVVYRPAYRVGGDPVALYPP